MYIINKTTCNPSVYKIKKKGFYVLFETIRFLQ